jgi:hypothetical protein
MHIEQVLADVPPAQRCQCRERGQADNSNAQKPKKTSFWQ